MPKCELGLNTNYNDEKFYNMKPRAQCYKTFNVQNLQMHVIS